MLKFVFCLSLLLSVRTFAACKNVTGPSVLHIASQLHPDRQIFIGGNSACLENGRDSIDMDWAWNYDDFTEVLDLKDYDVGLGRSGEFLIAVLIYETNWKGDLATGQIHNDSQRMVVITDQNGCLASWESSLGNGPNMSAAEYITDAMNYYKDNANNCQAKSSSVQKADFN